MIIKYVVAAILVAIVISLGSGLYFMFSDKGKSKRMANSLTVRIGLSVALFIMLFIAWAVGMMHPHPVLPDQDTGELVSPDQGAPD